MSFVGRIQLLYTRYYSKVIVLYGLIVGIASIFYFYNHGLITIIADQHAHLNIGRQILDSLTPGISQFGSWPPMIHLLIAPFALNNFLWQSGLAGSIPVVVTFIISLVYLYKSALLLTKSHWAGIVAVLLYSLNPNILQLAVSPLMEMPFFMFSLTTFYYFARWLENEKLSYLVAAAFFTAMAGLTRFEGFIFPFAIAAVIVLKYVIEKRSWSRLEATLLVFLCLAVSGIVYSLVYNAVFLGDPLAFIRGQWSAYAQQHIEETFLPTEHNIKNVFLYYGQAVVDNIGLPLVIISLICFLIILVIKRNIKYLSLYIFLIAPIFFYLLSLYQGSTVILVKKLPPYIIANNRYGALFMLFGSLMPALFLGLILQYQKFRKASKVIILVCAVSISLLLGARQLAAGAIDQQEYTFLWETERVPGFSKSIEALKGNYDGGKILITRSVNGLFVISVGIGISNFIQEANHVFWQKSLERPWLYARYIIMFNPKIGGWAQARDEISKRWYKDDTLYSFYDKFVDNERYRILKINEEKTRRYAQEHQLDPQAMPSLNTSLTRWDPNTQEEKINPKGQKWEVVTDSSSDSKSTSLSDQNLAPRQTDRRQLLKPQTSFDAQTGYLHWQVDEQDRLKFEIYKLIGGRQIFFDETTETRYLIPLRRREGCYVIKMLTSFGERYDVGESVCIEGSVRKR